MYRLPANGVSPTDTLLSGVNNRPANVAVDNIEDALREAIRVADGEALVLVTGSIFVAAGARDTWYNL